MKTYHCSRCGHASYSAHRETDECPHCSEEKLLIINPRLIDIGFSLSRAMIILDRRVSSEPVELERRGAPRASIPLGWFVTSV